MIIGFDHVAMTTADVDRDIEEFHAHGFELLFLERDLPNHKDKSKLLARYAPLHTIAYLTPPAAGSVAIELIEYGRCEAGASGPFLLGGGSLLLNTRNAALEQDFLREALGLNLEREGVLSLSSPIPRWSVHLEIVADDAAQDCMLDSPGFTCAAFYSNDVEADTHRAQAAGGCDPAGPFSFTVNGKAMKISMFRSPGGALFELLQPEV